MLRASTKSPSEYHERVTAFIDILGFSERVRETANSAADIAGIASALAQDVQGNPDDRRAVTVYDSGGGPNVVAWKEDIVATESIDFCQSTFSDNIVMSTKHNRRAVGHLCDHAQLMMRRLMEQGLLCRGGITVGPLVHDRRKGVVFGPALLEAVTLEAQVADYPRVVVSARMANLLSTRDNNEPSLTRYFARCDDGMYMVDPFADYAVMRERIEQAKLSGEPYLNEVFEEHGFPYYQGEAEFIRKGLVKAVERSMGTPRHYRKVAWFVEYFNKQVAAPAVAGLLFVDKIRLTEQGWRVL